jgi:hypothetical protein
MILVEATKKWVSRSEIAKVASKGNLLSWGEMLVAEKDNAIANEGFTNSGNVLTAEFLSEVDARDFCTESSSEAPNGAEGCR